MRITHSRSIAWHRLLTALVLSVFAATLRASPASANAALIRTQQAHHIGVLAYVYGYPMVDMLRQMRNDTLYFGGWFDLSREPLIVHAPDTAGRYYTLAATDFQLLLTPEQIPPASAFW